LVSQFPGWEELEIGPSHRIPPVKSRINKKIYWPPKPVFDGNPANPPIGDLSCYSVKNAISEFILLAGGFGQSTPNSPALSFPSFAILVLLTRRKIFPK
jgi:hypothetical protein